MGGAVSAGQTNDELIDNLVEAEYIKSADVEKVFRAVDRGDYYLPEHKDSAYKDLAWKNGNIHLSAPCIYAEVMESLQLKPGLSFLNLGSGTGYLSTLAGMMLGPYGRNHGVEYHADVIQYAKERLEHFKKNADSFDEFEFCEPTFTQGNCLLLNSGYGLYDRVYCGASCPPEHENYMRNLIKVGGILVMPVEDHLLQVIRKDETTWEKKSVLPVSFASLIVPNGEKEVSGVDLPEVSVMTLQEICRIAVRRILRENICKEHPEIIEARKSVKPTKQTKTPRRRRINIAPMGMGMGMVLLGNLPDTDSEEEGADHSEDSSRNSEVSHDISGFERGDDPEDYIIQQMLAMQRRFVVMSRRERLEQLQEQDDDDDDDETNEEKQEDQGISEPMEDTEDEYMPENGSQFAEDTDRRSRDVGKKYGCKEETDNIVSDIFSDKQVNSEGNPIKQKETSIGEKPELSDTSTDDQDTDIIMSNTVSNAIPISQSNSERCRYSSTASISTSFTSGIGTCSSIEESADLDGITPELETHTEEAKMKGDSSFQENLFLSPAEKDNGPTDKSEAELEEKAIKAYVATIKNHDCDKVSSSDCDVEGTEQHNGVASAHSTIETVLKTPPTIAIGVDSVLKKGDQKEHHTKGSDSDGDVNDIDMERSKENDEQTQQRSVTENGFTFRQCLREKVEMLPIPLALKQFLLFYRM